MTEKKFLPAKNFSDCDLIGIPVRLVVSKKVGMDNVEWKERTKKESKVLSVEQVSKELKS